MSWWSKNKPKSCCGVDPVREKFVIGVGKVSQVYIKYDVCPSCGSLKLVDKSHYIEMNSEKKDDTK